MAVAVGSLTRSISRRIWTTRIRSCCGRRLRGAGYFRLTRYADKIASYFDREEPYDDLRDDALFAYALAMPGETTRGRVRGMLRKIDSITPLSRYRDASW